VLGLGLFLVTHTNTAAPEPGPSAAAPPPSPDTPKRQSTRPTSIASPSAPTGPFLASARYTIRNTSLDACLGYRSDYPLTVQVFCSDRALYRIGQSAAGYRVELVDQPGKCLFPLDAAGVVHENDRTQPFPCSRTNAAFWDFYAESAGVYRIRFKLNTHLCLSAKDDRPTAHGKPAPTLATCIHAGAAGYDRQLWTVQAID
jgi:hypothetical protein